MKSDSVETLIQPALQPVAAPFAAHGEHLLIDFYQVDKALLGDELRLESLLIRAAEVAGARILWERFHHFGDGAGVTGVLLLAESHISIHTWPEHGFVAADIFMCGQAQVERALTVLRLGFTPGYEKVRSVSRGCADMEENL